MSKRLSNVDSETFRAVFPGSKIALKLWSPLNRVTIIRTIMKIKTKTKTFQLQTTSFSLWVKRSIYWPKGESVEGILWTCMEGGILADFPYCDKMKEEVN